MKKILSFLFVGLLLFLLVGCAVTETESYLVAIPDSDNNVTLEVGGTKQITATYEGGTLEWLSSDESVVSVTNGLLTALKAGTATITARLKEKTEISATITVTVNEKTPEVIEVTGIALAGKKTEVEVGDEFNLRAVITPTNATEQTVTWASSDASVAKVENGKVTALKAGSTEISATAGGKTDKFTLKVNEKEPEVVEPEDIYLDHTKESLKIGETDQLEWGIDPEEASQEVEWSVEPADCATISETGLLTAIKGGAVTIKVSAKGHPEISDSYQLRIFDNIEGITIKGNNSMQPGSTQVLTGEILHKRADGTTINTMSEFKWESADPETATINDSGLVTAIKAGSVVIKAVAQDSGQFTAEFTISIAAISVSIGENNYLTLEEALAAAQENDVIELGAGTYTSAITLDKSNITLKGNGTVLANTVTIADGVDGLTITGFKFSDKGTVISPEKADATGLKNITFDNVVYRKAKSADDASIHFYVPCENFKFINSEFNFVTNRGIRFEKPIHNLVIDNCIFVNAESNYDTIRAMDLIDGDVQITNNIIDTCCQTLIQLRFIGTGTYNVLNNQFKNAACASLDIREAKVADFEGKAEINVIGNTFDGGANAWGTIRLRNSWENGAIPNALEKVEVNFNYNKFLNITFGDNKYFVDKPTNNCTEAAWNMDYNYTDMGELQESWLSGMAKSHEGWFASEEALQLAMLVAEINENENMLVVGEIEGVTKTPYATIALALAAAKEGDTIVLAAGTYAENVEINVSGIKIYGPNAGVDPATGKRNAEAEFTATLKIASETNNVVVDGIAFSGAGSFNCVGKSQNIALMNAYVHDTNEVAWKEGRDNDIASTICFNHLTNDTDLQDILVSHCLFENLHMAGLYIARILNVKVENCTFHNFDQDAIRGDGGYNNGKWEFLNNKFYNDTLKGTNGIYLQSVSGDKVLQEIYILNNEFINIGDSTKESQYMGAFSCRTYQECGMRFYFKFNTVDGCLNGLHVRNNGESDLTKYTEEINYNIFKGLTGFYHRNFTAGSADNAGTNPVEANFDYNLFLDAEDNVLTYDQVKERIFEVKSCANTFATKDELLAAIEENK